VTKNKRNQQITAIVIAILITISIVGAGVYGYFYSALSPNSTSYSHNSDYDNLKNQVNVLIQEVKLNPNDIQLQQDLGNAYYDLATVAQIVSPYEVIEDYNQAINYYQDVLNTKKDIHVLTDMATAAFYSGQDDLAEKSFKEALIEDPDFQPALFNYGVFLSEIKKDYSTAIHMWQTILDKEPNGPNADQLRQLITQTKDAEASQ